MNRKERPTMMIFPCETPELTHAEDLSPLPELTSVGIPRCTMPVPCGVCWYCAQYEARK